MDKFPGAHDCQNLTWEETPSLNEPRRSKESAIKTFLQSKSRDQMVSLVNSTKVYRKMDTNPSQSSPTVESGEHILIMERPLSPSYHSQTEVTRKTPAPPPEFPSGGQYPGTDVFPPEPLQRKSPLLSPHRALQNRAILCSLTRLAFSPSSAASDPPRHHVPSSCLPWGTAECLGPEVPWLIYSAPGRAR